MTDNAEAVEGWRNRETWAAALHINNDARRQQQAIRHAHACRTRSELADTLQAWFEELTDVEADRNPLRADLLQSALARVDWLALADEVNRKAGETG